MGELIIKSREIGDLKQRSNNPRTHSKRQLEQIAASIARFGFTNPVLIDDDDHLIAGHGRVAAAQLLGMKEVPTIRLRLMSEAEVRAYVIANNRLAEQAGWDNELLALEFDYLAKLEEDFDLTLTGFELPEIDAFLMKAPENRDRANQLDKVPPTSSGPAVTRSGDIWEVGDHRIVCGDATKADTYTALMNGEKATMIFSDPPYNLPIGKYVSGLGGVHHAEFVMASGEMSTDEFRAFLANAFCNQAKASINGSIHFQCIDWRHVEDLQSAAAVAYQELKNICVWAKSNGGMGSLYRSAHELIFVYKYGTAPHINNIELGKHGRYRTNVWNYPGANSFSASRSADLMMHPTVKPVAMIADAIIDCSRRADIVLDAFAGSGTTLVAAQKTKRRGYAIEIDPRFCDTIIRRMRDLFKIEASLSGDGRPFEELAIERKSADFGGISL